jgi:hypothetical protein
MLGMKQGVLIGGLLKALVTLSLLVLVACGGGGGGGSSPDAAASSSAAAVFKANAGADLTVSSGERVDLNPGVVLVGANSFSLGAGSLEVKGASSVARDVVAISWTQVEGSAIGLATNDTTSGKAYFIAPQTGGASSVKITYRLKLTNAGGEVSEDDLVITVKRVNKLPVVSAGGNINSFSGVTVALNATASDEDGSIASYSWKQVSGQSVTINNAATAAASFVAPTITAQLNLVFEVTVKDADGGASSAQVTVAVSPSDSPELNVFFPSAFGVYTGASIAAFGSVTVKNAELVSVMVDGGAGAKAAVVSADGSWRAADVALLIGTTMTLKVTALDSLGRSTAQTSILKVTGGDVGTGSDWSDTYGVGVDEVHNKLFVLTGGTYLSDLTLVSVDLSTGNRSAPISIWSDASQGINDSAIASMAYSPLAQAAYFTTASTVNGSKLIKIDVETGKRSLVSGGGRGAGTDFNYPASVAVSAEGKIYVADVNESTLIEVDAITGDRSVRADSQVTPLGVDAPDVLAVGYADYLYWIPNMTWENVLAETQISVTNGSYIISNGFDTTQGEAFKGAARGLVVSVKNNEAYLIDATSKLYAVNLFSGLRTSLGFFPGDTRITWHESKGLLYVVEHWIEGVNIYLVDPSSGNKILISSK